MRRYLLVALLPVLAHAQTPAAFEGVVTYEIPNGDEQPATMRYSVKGSKVRIDMSGTGSASVIYDMQTGSVLALNHAMHAYMAIDPMAVNPAQLGGGLGPVAGMLSGMTASSPGGSLTRTGTTETIAGVTCSDYAFRSDTISVDVCNAPGMKSFPLKMTTSVGGTPGFTARATSVVRAVLSPALFSVPAGYQPLTGRNLEDLTKGSATAGDDDPLP
jgi:hypothetical protein